jgi:hypothetical protein
MGAWVSGQFARRQTSCKEVHARRCFRATCKYKKSTDNNRRVYTNQVAPASTTCVNVTVKRICRFYPQTPEPQRLRNISRQTVFWCGNMYHLRSRRPSLTGSAKVCLVFISSDLMLPTLCPLLRFSVVQEPILLHSP